MVRQIQNLDDAKHENLLLRVQSRLQVLTLHTFANIIFGTHVHGENLPGTFWFAVGNHSSNFFQLRVKLFGFLCIYPLQVGVECGVVTSRTVSVIFDVHPINDHFARLHVIWLSIAHHLTV